MPQPLEPLLSRWPELYPQLTGATEADNDPTGEVDRIREEVLAPILESRDIASTFRKSREAYRVWKESRTNEATDLDVVLAEEDRLDESLARITLEHQDDLGERAIRAIQEAIRLRKIARQSVPPHQHTWPAESWDRIGSLMASSELCLAAILRYLTTGEGDWGRLETLAAWGFQYAQNAYFDAGENGRDSVRVEDIPE